MAIAAAYVTDGGLPRAPDVDGASWNEWVEASDTLNYCCDDPLIDWLEAHGKDKGYTRDDDRPGYDPRTDFRAFVFKRAAEFEHTVTQHLSDHLQLVTICKNPADIRSRSHVEATWKAMCDGAEVIAQAALWDAEHATYGAPDLLVRSDILHRLFPTSMSEDDSRLPAADLPLGQVHYRVVDVKFTTLQLLKDGHAGSGHAKYMVQVWLYNEALGRLQGYAPSCSFLIGRRWKTSRERGSSALERLARIDHDRYLKGSALSLRELSLNACDWIRRVRSKGAEWQIFPTPSVEELRPNMRCRTDLPWHLAKSEIAAQLEDLTLLLRVTPEKRSQALGAGITRWTDPRCAAWQLGITGDKNPGIVDAVIHANHSDSTGHVVFPSHVSANESLWREPAVAELYVDFETVSDLNDDFTAFPQAGGQPLFFMIGCGDASGTPDHSQWNHSVFVARRLTLSEERRIIEEWLAYINSFCKQLRTSLQDARLFHWSPAETSVLTEAYNAAKVRQQATDWPELPWIDLLNRVVREQPVTVRGAFGFGLKAIAKALYAHRLIKTSWDDGPTDGLGAMVGAWWCDREAGRLGTSMADLELMKEIENYNETDCRVMAEALAFMRTER